MRKGEWRRRRMRGFWEGSVKQVTGNPPGVRWDHIQGGTMPIDPSHRNTVYPRPQSLSTLPSLPQKVVFTNRENKVCRMEMQTMGHESESKWPGK